MKVTKSIQNTGADPEGLPPPPPNRREREGRKYDPQEGSAPNPVDTILIYFFFLTIFGSAGDLGGR